MFRKLLHKGAERIMTMTAPQTTEIQWLQKKIGNWLSSPYRLDQITGERYYLGFHDILHRKKTAIGKDGQLVEVDNVANEKIVDNLFAVAVDTKNSYLLSQEIVLVSENEGFQKELDKIINADFLRKLKNVGEASLTGGVAYLYVYYDEEGNLRFKMFPAHSILPFYTSDDRDELEMAVRYYEEEKKNSITDEVIKRIEVYTPDGIDNYILVGNILMIDKDNPHVDYMTIDGQAYTWHDKIPIIAFKLNSKEQPLIRRCKSLQDAINILESDFTNNMLEDVNSTVLILQNYDGESLSEFRKNLNAYKAIKVRSESGATGGVSTLNIEVNATNYSTILSLLKQALVQNCRYYDGSNTKLEGDPNQVSIKSCFQNMDIDANATICEYKCSFDKLLWFVKSHLKATGKGDYFDEAVKVIFNKDILINESAIMQDLISAGVRIPNRILLSQVPFVNNIDEAEKLLEQEDAKLIDQLDPYNNAKNGSSRPKPKQDKGAKLMEGNK